MSEKTKTQVKAREKKEIKLNVSKKNLAIIISAAVVALIMVVGSIIFVVNAIQNDTFFDYLKSDLSQYIEFTKDFRNFELNIDIAEPRDIDIEVTKLNMLRGDKPTTAWVKESTANLVIKPGDVVYIWYRGYLVEDDGEIIEVDGMCNFSGDEPYALEIGSNSFVPGFELDLVGHRTGETAKFEKITSGSVESGTIAYISYTKNTTKDNGDTEKTTGSVVRIDLSDTTLDDRYGEGFTEKLKSFAIGTKSEFKLQLNGKEVSYTDFTVNFVTSCETAENSNIKANCYFPYDYSNNEDLRNEDAVFEVYIDKIDSYYEEMPEFDDEYLKKKIEDKKIAVTLEKLDEYEGETLVDKYDAYAKELMFKLYENEKESLIESAIWSYFSAISKVKKYPVSKVDEKYYSYATDIYNLYLTNGGQIYNSYYGTYQTYDTFNEYANAYVGINSYSEYYYYGETAWKYEVYDMAREFVGERLVLYYVMRETGLTPSDSLLKSEMDKIKQEYVDEYIEQYLENEDKTKEDYTEAEYKEFCEARRNEILGYYGDDHFEERVYYSIVGESVTEWPGAKFVTLNERRAYPVDK